MNEGGKAEGSSSYGQSLKVSQSEKDRALRKINPSRPSFISRARNLLMGAVITATGGAAIEATVHPAEKTIEAVTRGIGNAKGEAGKIVDVDHDAFGKYLTMQPDGRLIISDKPEVVEVEYIAQADPTSQLWNGGNIIIQQEYEPNASGGQQFPPEAIKPTHAVRVAGGTYPDYRGPARFELTIDGKKYTVGEWFRLSDEQGNPVNPQGQLLSEGEDPYHVAANFVTVLNSPVSQQAQTQ